MPVQAKLYGTKAERFEEIKAHLSDELGYDPTNPEVVGYLMGLFEASSPLVATHE